MAAAAATIRGAVPAVEQRRSLWTGTPEIYFSKAIDNSRLVKVEDPRRNREMKQFGTALACLFLLVFTYAWQHFKAIEYGYQIESAKRELSEHDRDESRAAPGRCVPARSRANRSAGAPHGPGPAGAGTSDPHGRDAGGRDKARSWRAILP